eukprot:6196005-Pleurochrysis_carterae.AAC.2
MLVLSCTQHGDLRQRFQSLCAQPHRPIRWMHTVLFRKERLALNEDVSSLWRQSLAKRGLRCRSPCQTGRPALQRTQVASLQRSFCRKSHSCHGVAAFALHSSSTRADAAAFGRNSFSALPNTFREGERTLDRKSPRFGVMKSTELTTELLD